MHQRILDRRAYIVDDDEKLRTMIRRILTSDGVYSEEFESAEAILDGYSDRPLGCVLLDVRLPGMSGLDLLLELEKKFPPNPVIVVSGYADLPMAVAAVKSGALNILQKPFQKQELLSAVHNAFELIQSKQSTDTTWIQILSPKEKDVLLAFGDGAPNKVVADRLNLSLRTVEMHRANIVKKMNVVNMTQALLKAKETGYIN